jgi:uncharacterized membrane protein YedE/YeeE
MKKIIFLLAGIYFGIVLTKGETISWFRMQEMFRFQSFRLYGIFLTAIPVALIGTQLLLRSKRKALDGTEIQIAPKKYHHGLIIGGTIFGIGWAMTGACPGPLFAQIGCGATVAILTFISALAGTWVYSYFREKLP